MKEVNPSQIPRYRPQSPWISWIVSLCPEMGASDCSGLGHPFSSTLKVTWDRDAALADPQGQKPNHVPSISMVHGSKLADAWMAERQVRAFNHALGIDSRPERNKRTYDEVRVGRGPTLSQIPETAQTEERGLGAGK